VVAGEFGVNVGDQFVIGAVEGDDTFQFEVGGRCEGDLAVDLRGRKVASANFQVSRISLCKRWSREELPVSQLTAFTMMEPAAFRFADRIESRRFSRRVCVHHVQCAIHVEVNFGLRGSSVSATS